VKSTPTISSAIAKLRKILMENKGNDTVYGKAADGNLPIVVHVQNKVSACLESRLLASNYTNE
jgi:hypothetical protein